jgi:hypothetical protein
VDSLNYDAVAYVDDLLSRNAQINEMTSVVEAKINRMYNLSLAKSQLELEDRKKWWGICKEQMCIIYEFGTHLAPKLLKTYRLNFELVDKRSNIHNVVNSGAFQMPLGQVILNSIPDNPRDIEKYKLLKEIYHNICLLTWALTDKQCASLRGTLEKIIRINDFPVFTVFCLETRKLLSHYNLCCVRQESGTNLDRITSDVFDAKIKNYLPYDENSCNELLSDIKGDCDLPYDLLVALGFEDPPEEKHSKQHENLPDCVIL